MRTPGPHRLLPAALVLALCLTVLPARAATPAGFSDLPATHWAYDYVMTCVSRGAIEGTTPPVNGVGTFEPGRAVTSGELLTLLTRLLIPTEIPAANPGEHWAERYYIAAVRTGLLPATIPSGLADLDHPLNREEMAWTAAQVARFLGEDLTIGEPQIADLDQVDRFFLESVKLCYTAGYMNGTGGGRFSPKATMNRGEMAALICRIMGYTPRVSAR